MVVVDAFMADQLWPGMDPIGKRIRTGGADSTTPWITVVGVVGRVKQDALDAIRASRCTFRTRSTRRARMNVVVRSRSDPAVLERGAPANRSASSIAICRSTECGR